MPQHIAASDSRLTWPGAISIQLAGDWAMPWRIPHGDLELFADELAEMAAMPAGVRISFQSNTSSIEGFCNSFPERSPIDLLIDGEYVASADTQNKTTFRFKDLGSAAKTVELWLPQVGEFRKGGVVVLAASPRKGVRLAGVGMEHDAAIRSQRPLNLSPRRRVTIRIVAGQVEH